MKKLIINGIIIFAVGLLVPQLVQAQGTFTYLSNLDQPSIGSDAVGSDSWVATGFRTGTNTLGYVLNSIQLGMTNASGNPNGFIVMLYSAISSVPGTSLGTLNGSLNPVTTGTYTYTAPANLTLLPNRNYFIAATAGTVIANGAYEWSYPAGVNYNPNGGWQTPLAFTAINIYQSSDGSHWSFSGGAPQFAIDATSIPEPSTLGLFALGGWLFLRHRRKAKAA